MRRSHLLQAVLGVALAASMFTSVSAGAPLRSITPAQPPAHTRATVAPPPRATSPKTATTVAQSHRRAQTSSTAITATTADSSIFRVRHNLVGLGDSITFGYGLTPNRHPSPLAFPFLVAKANGLQTVDLGVPGFTSDNLLRALQTPSYQAALQNASVVTIDIGSNDLLHAEASLLDQVKAGKTKVAIGQADADRVKAAILHLAGNLNQIITAVRKQTPAPIVLLNLYDPFPDNLPIHGFAEQAIAGANQVILQSAAQTQCILADAYSPVHHHQETLIRVKELDIHPTAAGQRVLADRVIAALKRPLWNEPMYYAIAPNGTLIRQSPSSQSNGISWLHGNEADLVTGLSGSWLRVVTQTSLTGYVPQRNVTLLLRPWNDVTFRTFTARVIPIANRHAFVWNGVVYMQADDLAALGRSKFTWNEGDHKADFTSTEPRLTGRSTVVLATTGVSAMAVTRRLVTSGIEVKVDGEVVRLPCEAVIAGGRIYVPVEPVWTALGGTVTRDSHGLRLLSANGS